jgi:hypothetical protein
MLLPKRQQPTKPTQPVSIASEMRQFGDAEICGSAYRAPPLGFLPLVVLDCNDLVAVETLEGQKSRQTARSWWDAGNFHSATAGWT